MWSVNKIPSCAGVGRVSSCNSHPCMVVSDLSEIRGTAFDVVAVVAPLTQPSAAEQAEFTSLCLV